MWKLGSPHLRNHHLILGKVLLHPSQRLTKVISFVQQTARMRFLRAPGGHPWTPGLWRRKARPDAVGQGGAEGFLRRTGKAACDWQESASFHSEPCSSLSQLVSAMNLKLGSTRVWGKGDHGNLDFQKGAACYSFSSVYSFRRLPQH